MGFIWSAEGFFDYWPRVYILVSFLISLYYFHLMGYMISIGIAALPYVASSFSLAVVIFILLLLVS